MTPRRALSLVLLVGLTGCAQSLQGTWVTNQASGVAGGVVHTLVLAPDGTLSITLLGVEDPEVIGVCSGTASVEGLRWSATPAQLQFRGTAACSGSITCTAPGEAPTTVTCAELGLDLADGDCGWMFSDSSDGTRYLSLYPCTGGLSALDHHSFRRP